MEPQKAGPQRCGLPLQCKCKLEIVLFIGGQERLKRCRAAVAAKKVRSFWVCFSH